MAVCLLLLWCYLLRWSFDLLKISALAPHAQREMNLEQLEWASCKEKSEWNAEWRAVGIMSVREIQSNYLADWANNIKIHQIQAVCEIISFPSKTCFPHQWKCSNVLDKDVTSSSCTFSFMFGALCGGSQQNTGAEVYSVVVFNLSQLKQVLHHKAFSKVTVSPVSTFSRSSYCKSFLHVWIRNFNYLLKRNVNLKLC